MVTRAVWLYFGWRKKARSVQFLSTLPFGVGLFIVGPLLLLVQIMVVWWFVADWRAIPQPPSAPAPQDQKKPSQAASGNGARAILFHGGCLERAVPTSAVRQC